MEKNQKQLVHFIHNFDVQEKLTNLEIFKFSCTFRINIFFSLSLCAKMQKKEANKQMKDASQIE